jgi:hypothetical protein
LQNQCSRGKAITITYFERVPVALIIQHANVIFSLEDYVIYGLSDCTVFSFIVPETAWIFGKGY